MLPAILSAHGALPPQKLLAELKKIRKNVGALEPQLLSLSSIVREGPSLSEALREPGPIFLQLEGGAQGLQYLLTLAIVVMNALARSPVLEEDNLHLWVFFEELSQALSSPLMQNFLPLFGTGTRHGHTSFYGGGQHTDHVNRALLSLITGLFLFRLPPGELAQLRPILGGLEWLRPEDLAALDVGQAWTLFAEASDRSFRDRVQRVNLRPTATWSGGETIKVVSG